MKKLIEIKSIDAEKKTISAYVSTYNWDRMDERFVKGAWDLSAYLKNPVGLWAHNMIGTEVTAGRPIMKAVKIVEDDSGLFAESEFDTENKFAMDVFSQYQRGFLSTFSVGFRPKPKGYRVEDISEGRKGLVWTNVELLEYSAVPIPANPEAVVEKDFEFAGLKFEDTMSLIKSFKDEITKDNEQIKNSFIKPDIELENCLKGLIDMAKACKNEKIDSKKLLLVKSSIEALQEIILGNEDESAKNSLKEMADIVDSLTVIFKNNMQERDPQDFVSKFMTQFDAALGRTGK